MGQYSIKELETLSGIKAHTLRIWEKRFNLLSPQRTDTNIRYYTDEDLVKLLNVSVLTTNGSKISEIASFSKEEMKSALNEISNTLATNQKKVSDLIIPMTQLDEEGFNNVYKGFIEKYGIERTLVEIIRPFLEKVGLLWLGGDIKPPHEHIVSNIIRQKLSTAIDDLPFPPKDNNKAILFLPEGEFHEIGLMFFHFLLRKEGINVYYLGQSTPTDQVKYLMDSISPEYVITYSIIKSKEGIEKMLNCLSDNSDSRILYVENKHQMEYGISYPPKVLKVSDYKELMSRVKSK